MDIPFLDIEAIKKTWRNNAPTILRDAVLYPGGSALAGYLGAKYLTRGDIDPKTGAMLGLTIGGGKLAHSLYGMYKDNKTKSTPISNNSDGKPLNASRPRYVAYFAKEDYALWIERLQSRMDRISGLERDAIDALDSAYDARLASPFGLRKPPKSDNIFKRVKRWWNNEGENPEVTRYKDIEKQISRRESWVNNLRSDKQKLRAAIEMLNADTVPDEFGGNVQVTDAMRDEALARLRGANGLMVSRNELNRRIANMPPPTEEPPIPDRAWYDKMGDAVRNVGKRISDKF